MKSAIFSFFSGVGFLDLGFENSGSEVVLVNEVYEPFMDGYKHSRKSLGIAEPRFGYELGSIEELFQAKNIRRLRQHVKEMRDCGKVVGFVGGPPCPDFSVAGKNRGHLGENGKLSKSYVDLICKVLPDFFLFENVRGLWRTKKHREFYDAMKLQLTSYGYSCFDRLTNSIEYGVPQDRDRIILVGFRGAPRKIRPLSEVWESYTAYPGRMAFEFTWPTTNSPRKNLSPPKDIPLELTVGHWFEINNVENHINAANFFKPRAGLERFRKTAEGDVSRKSFKRLHRWRYSPTAAYGNNEVHIHPFLPRRITVSEALAIQSLPKGFELPEQMTLTAMFKSIGNGVPYIAANGIARMINNEILRAYK